jgi:hypothetical protein
MMTLIRIVFLFLTLPKRWILQKYRITQSKFTLSYFTFGQRLYIKISTFLLSTLNLVINKLLLSDRKKLGSKLAFQIILFNAI